MRRSVRACREERALKALIDLQQLDLKIQRYKAREDEIPKQKYKYDIHRRRLEAELKASDEKVKQLVVEQRDCEGDIAQKQEQINKYEQQLNAVKKNDEYQALLHEIDICKKQIAVKEERIITIMLEIDDAKAALEEDKQRIAAEQSSIDAECAKIDAELAEAVKEREALQEQRKPYLAEIEDGLLKRYLRISKSKNGGAAVVPMRNDTCTGCNMGLRPQLVNEILAGEKIQSCPNCGRILYFEANFGDVAAQA